MVRQETLDMAARLLRQVEGCVLTPYQDSGGTWTIGIGTIAIKGVPVSSETSPITIEQAEEYLEDELLPKAEFVVENSPENATDNQLAAIISFTYNEGEHAYFTSSLRSKWLANDLQGAAQAFAQWDIIKGKPSRGLGNRRAIEAKIFLGELSV